MVGAAVVLESSDSTLSPGLYENSGLTKTKSNGTNRKNMRKRKICMRGGVWGGGGGCLGLTV